MLVDLNHKWSKATVLLFMQTPSLLWKCTGHAQRRWWSWSEVVHWSRSAPSWLLAFKAKQNMSIWSSLHASPLTTEGNCHLLACFASAQVRQSNKSILWRSWTNLPAMKFPLVPPFCAKPPHFKRAFQMVSQNGGRVATGNKGDSSPLAPTFHFWVANPMLRPLRILGDAVLIRQLFYIYGWKLAPSLFAFLNKA